mmetsp:Transcript_6713/g.15229  ORF Transcript_6713/g.15229 Transcript_6713/m.15229 type:complete len:400 (-) Transcript_6713:1623-2822(-)
MHIPHALHALRAGDLRHLLTSSKFHGAIGTEGPDLALGAHHEGGHACGLDLHRFLVSQLLHHQCSRATDLPGAGRRFDPQLPALGVAEADDQLPFARRPGHAVARIPHAPFRDGLPMRQFSVVRGGQRHLRSHHLPRDRWNCTGWRKATRLQIQSLRGRQGQAALRGWAAPRLGLTHILQLRHRLRGALHSHGARCVRRRQRLRDFLTAWTQQGSHGPYVSLQILHRAQRSARCGEVRRGGAQLPSTALRPQRPPIQRMLPQAPHGTALGGDLCQGACQLHPGTVARGRVHRRVHHLMNDVFDKAMHFLFRVHLLLSQQLLSPQGLGDQREGQLPGGCRRGRGIPDADAHVACEFSDVGAVADGGLQEHVGVVIRGGLFQKLKQSLPLQLPDSGRSLVM